MFRFAVCKLMSDQFPTWSHPSRFLSYTKTANEYSLVCEAHLVPNDITAERGWGCIKVIGVLDFSLIGIIAKMTTILAAVKISVFVVSTHDTDYLLIKQENVERTIQALMSGGYHFVNE